MVKGDEARAMIVVTPTAEVPLELQGHAIVIDWPLPDRAEIGEVLDAAVAVLRDDMREKVLTELSNGARERAIDAAVGLTQIEAESTFAKSLVSSRTIDPRAVANEKRRVISRERVLEFFDPLPGGLEAVGGLELLKAWLGLRKAAYTAVARAYGVPAPRGLLLVGVPGCGKSLAAKAIATALGIILLRLDMGALKSKFVGDSEANIRRALRVAETVAPCVVWIDEIEKALAGATQGAADGGVSSDALGVVLSWMQEKTGSVFVVATANDITALPPELLRKGRFDDIFFVDLPTRVERVQIMRAALRKYNRAPDGIDLEAIARATEGFTGAELDATIPEALFFAFGDGARPICTEDILRGIRGTVPLSKTAGDKVARLREWATGRARRASAQEESATSTARSLDI
jgi:SpoVK/Ycf46/Vps4 family AAA+-type ATPase